MLVSVNETIFNNETHDLIIKATNLEQMLLADDLFTPIDGDEEVSFLFDTSNMSHRKYLYKLSQRRKEKSLGERVEALCGSIMSISEGFLER